VRDEGDRRLATPRPCVGLVGRAVLLGAGTGNGGVAVVVEVAAGQMCSASIRMRSILLSYLLLSRTMRVAWRRRGRSRALRTLRPLVRECVEAVGHEVGVGHRGVGRELSRNLRIEASLNRMAKFVPSGIAKGASGVNSGRSPHRAGAQPQSRQHRLELPSAVDLVGVDDGAWRRSGRCSRLDDGCGAMQGQRGAASGVGER